MTQPTDLTGEQKGWALAAAILFLIAIGFLGIAFAEGAMLTFAVGWVLLQIFGFVGALNIAKGDTAHPLFKAQVFLHVIAVLLLAAVILKANQ